ncbi:MAG TPA: DNA replication and repair protein RecF [Pyrinomonadaceae bacterium]|jgi:DNA replication and repair protein RecF|nr:DNA replication and repair protein RecF [Pyrinomonadaceae bacterium]
MILDALEVNNFRNLSGKISWGPGLNIICGNNGQGKTNWLEAIHTLSRTKSFRTQRLQESIRFGEETAFVAGEVSTGSDLHRELRITLRENTKAIWVNGKREPLARYLGQLQVFAFTADQLEVVRGMPEARRHFIDRGVASLRPAYVQTVSDYNRVIKQKNRILQDAAEREIRLEETENLVAPWNEQLARLGTEIHKARVDYTAQLNRVLERTLFEPAELQIRYASSLESKGDLDDYETLLGERLRLRLPAEAAAGRALIGPHRDDLGIHLEGREIRVYGSSGQQRSALLLLDLAAISVYNSWYNDYPLFLVDDVDAELDEKRIRRLLEYLEGRTQTFITTSKRSHVEGFLSKATVHEIVKGEATSAELNSGGFRAAAAAAESV